MDTKEKMAHARDVVTEFNPDFVKLTDEVVFGKIWSRTGLSSRDRSLITIASLIAMYRPEELQFHFKKALENGVTKDELKEVLTHLAFYAGWPAVVSATLIAVDVCKEAG